jgi:hypothetical protein
MSSELTAATGWSCDFSNAFTDCIPRCLRRLCQSSKLDLVRNEVVRLSVSIGVPIYVPDDMPEFIDIDMGVDVDVDADVYTDSGRSGALC